MMFSSIGFLSFDFFVKYMKDFFKKIISNLLCCKKAVEYLHAERRLIGFCINYATLALVVEETLLLLLAYHVQVRRHWIHEAVSTFIM